MTQWVFESKARDEESDAQLTQPLHHSGIVPNCFKACTAVENNWSPNYSFFDGNQSTCNQKKCLFYCQSQKRV